MAVRAHLRGVLIGTMWLPAIRASRGVEVDLTLDRTKLGQRSGCLQTLLTRICKDGDFQTCRLTPSTEIVLTTWRVKGIALVRREKRIPLAAFPSAANFLETA